MSMELQARIRQPETKLLITPITADIVDAKYDADECCRGTEVEEAPAAAAVVQPLRSRTPQAGHTLERERHELPKFPGGALQLSGSNAAPAVAAPVEELRLFL